MAPAEHKSFCQLLKFPGVSVMVLMVLINTQSSAQDTNETCPCFNHEEVQSIFLGAVNLTDEQGMSNCSAEDYSVELKAEVVVWDQDFTVVAHTRVDWADFDPGGCKYIDTKSDPVVERNVKWSRPAPQTAVRACFNIISSVIAKSDTSGMCNTYP
jgi:hypothetical protein